ncbi:MAG: mandelate racemase/muconate lactonizing enzyme family protein [Betaproteobacteria bacterium]|nr:mandelate racemase/muconate lactonizing enzyme family protein [Betaproteobacteria bacterium]
MKIKAIRAAVHRFEAKVPLMKKPLQRQAVVCEVETSGGIAGFGMTGGHFLPHAVTAALNREFLPVVKDLDARDTAALHEKVWWKLNQRSMTGVVSSALSALDIALWDIHGKHAGRTIAQLLGGARDWAPTYCTFGFHEYDFDQLVEAARLQLKKGHRRLKMVVGVHKGGWQEDARRVRAVREAIGPDVELMMDANYKFNPVDARQLCRAIEDCNLTWFEEPLYQNDTRAMADLRSHTRIPIAAGQNEGHRWRLRELVLHQAVDILQPNVCYCGGYTEAQKVAHLAQAFNLPIANGGGWPLFNMHVMAGLMNGWRVEFHLDMQAVGEMMFVNPPQPKDNVIKIPAQPGLGLKPNRAVLKDTVVK